jgi:hypothetical protein
MPSKADIQLILDESLPPAGEQRIVEELLDDPQLTEELLQQHRLDLALRALFGTRNQSLEAAVMASIAGSSDECLSQRTMNEIEYRIRPRKSALRRWVAPLAAAAAVVLGIGLTLHSLRAISPVAVLVSAKDARWEGAADPASGGFTPGTWKLVSGVAELRTSDGASVTLQGPAEFTLRSSRVMDLQSGVLSATVPPKASGFTVQTAAGRVVDIGTKFGVRTGSASQTETHVFDGHVQVAPIRRFGTSLLDLRGGEALALDPASSASRRFAADPSRFPQSSAIHAGLLTDGGWEPGGPRIAGNAPQRFGIWGGDEAEVITAWKGVKPHEGEGMLRLTSSVAAGQTPDERFMASEQWQFVDLRPFADEIARGGVIAEASVWIRQVGGKPVSYQMHLAGFNAAFDRIGPPLAARSHPRMTAFATEGTLGEPQSPHWRVIRVSMELPPSTLLVYVSPRAKIGAHPDPGVAHLLDAAEFKLSIPPRPETGK